MSLKFDLTIITPELLDSVVSMDKSPAYDAFRTEITAILADFNKTEHFGSSLKIDENALVESCGDTLRNMHGSFFVWLMRDELRDGRNIDAGYSTYLKLFFKANRDKLVSLNGGSLTVSAEDIAPLRKKFLEEIKNDPALYKSVKDFFAGYIYGYFFNFLTEQKSMVKYAEFLVCMGIMTGKLTSSVSAQQKVLLRMASLLSHDRIKYVSGFVPVDLVCEIIYSRFAFPNLSDSELSSVKDLIKNKITSEYEMQKDDEGNDLISVSVLESAMSEMNGKYISVSEHSAEIHEKCFEGVRLFLDNSDAAENSFTKDSVAAPINEKCAADLLDYYNSDRAPVLDTALKSDTRGYRYPLVYKDGNDYLYSPVYAFIADSIPEKLIYTTPDISKIPVSDFPFAEELLRTNPIRSITGNSSKEYCIRKDAEIYLSNLAQIKGNSTLSDPERKMLMLEKLLRIVSGNCTAEEYNSVLEKNVFGTKLYEEYIDFRIKRLCEKSMTSLDAKKKLLEGINALG